MNAVVTEATDQQVANPFASAPVVAAPTGAVAQALVQREVAEVQASMMMARKFPRDPIASMDRILQACTRHSLAEVAVYQYARGGQDVSGPSIRLAEEIARGWGNISTGVAELHRANGVSEVMAYAVDLETGYRDEKRFQVRHWRDTKRGGYAVTEERDIYELIANMGARRKRACILSVIPGDVVEAALKQCEITLRAKAGEVTPERIKGMLEKFAEFNVTQAMLEKRIQRRMDSVTGALLLQLGKIYNSLKDGMSVPADWFEIEGGSGEEAPETGTSKVREKLRQRREGAAPAAEATERQPGQEGGA